MPTATAKTSSEWPELIDLARCGDDEALGKIAEEVHTYLLAVAEGGIGHGLQGKFGASDIVQQSLVEASQTIGVFRGSSEAEMRSWLKQIVLHNLTDAARRYTETKSRDTSREVATDASGAWHSMACEKSKTASWMVSRNEQSDLLLAAVGQLPNRQRSVVEGRHRWGRSYQQIAAELGITANAARNLWTRAMHNLREKLSDQDGQPKRRAVIRRPR